MPVAAALRCVMWLAVFVQIEAQQLVEAETAQARELERSIAAAEVCGTNKANHVSSQTFVLCQETARCQQHRACSIACKVSLTRV